MISYRKFYSLVDIDDTQKTASKVFLNNRGVKEHIAIAEFLSAFSNRKPTYSEVATAFRYDKRLRRLIFKYIGFFEERMRSYLSNEYETIRDIPNFSFDLIKNQHILSKLSPSTDCYLFTNELFFSNIINIFNALPPNIISSYFNIKRPLKKNLEALIKLRNVVSHNRVLLNYKRFDAVTLLNGKISPTLLSNVTNLYNHLPEEVRESFKQELIGITNDYGNKLEYQVEWRLMDFYVVKVNNDF